MIPFDDLCDALDRHRRGLAPEPRAAAHEAHDTAAHAVGAESPHIESSAPGTPDSTGEIDLVDVVD
jgi:hypothetical protein